MGWIDVFSREQCQELFVESFKYCQENKGLVLHAWVVMTNHVHLIISSNTNKIEHIVRDLDKIHKQANYKSNTGKFFKKQKRVDVEDI